MRLIGLAVVLAVGLILTPLAAETQQIPKIRRGSHRVDRPSMTNINALRDGLRDLGYAEDRNIVIELGLPTVGSSGFHSS